MTCGALGKSLAALALLAVTGCGESSGAVLERLPEQPPPDGTSMPPSANLRVDVFVLRDVATCAVGDPCGRNDPDMRNGDCMEFDDQSGVRLGFRTDSIAFLPPDDPDVTSYPQAKCFRLTIDDAAADDLAASFDELRNRVFRLSGEQILLDIRSHDIGPMTAGFTRFQGENGIFLPTRPLDSNVNLASRDTDFTYAITGERDPDTGLTPIVDHCAGTIRDIRDGLAGAGYTWLTTECNSPEMLLRHWMFQVIVALRDVNGFDDLYGHDYPACGEGANDPSRWWPSPDECSEDPDAPTCGSNRCEGTDDDYVSHVLHAHWPRERHFVGNHCRNDRTDTNLDETDVDVGGVCDSWSR